MSKHETWRTRKFWEQTGGILVEEFQVVKKSKDISARYIDGLIVIDSENKIHETNYFDIKDKDVIIVQTKKSILGMYLLGQAFFSKLLIEQLKPKSIRTVAICSKSDKLLQEIAEKNGIEVVVIN